MSKIILLLPIIYAVSAFTQMDMRASIDPLLYPFYHGVASGDPLSDRVILWTRLTDDTLTLDSVQVDWRISTDTSMSNIVNSGSGYAKASKDWTYKIDATGLQPDTWYYYDFNGLGKNSLRGRTKTAPVGDIDSVRFAIVSCSNWEHGYFHAYKHLKDRNDFDCVLHLGDYIYEYETGGFSANISERINEPSHEIITLEDYRLRYSHYRLDSDLRNLHQQFPFINIWDDHETANDSYIDGADNHDPGTEGAWLDRKAVATQAYHEWLPIRSPNSSNTQIYRKFAWGDLIDLHMLDTRLEARVEQNTGAANDPNRPLLGTNQFNWLTNNLQTSNARWNILGQQVMIAPLTVFGQILNNDQWDGYAHERDQLFNFITTNSIENLVVLTGDIHTSWVNDIPLNNYDNSSCTGSLGVEFVVTSVTSTSFNLGFASSAIQLANSHVHYADLQKRGYMILDVNKTRIQGDYYYMDDVEIPTPGEYYGASYFVNDTEKCANEAITFSSNTGPLPIYAPQYPIANPIGVEEATENLVVFGAYPNPIIDEITVQFYLFEAEDVKVKLYDIAGKLVFNDIATALNPGVNYMKLNLQSIKAGHYNLVLETNFHKATKSLIKVQ
ncbi:MAG: alkaline phosphatase D family protein [Flavobacteriales bacterium]|nr:alkaline phosphatase D family protein [Flavobacteriales bacterium]